MDAQLLAIMEKMNALGRMLPDIHDIDTDDVAQVAEAKLLIAEMRKMRIAMFARMKVLKDAHEAA